MRKYISLIIIPFLFISCASVPKFKPRELPNLTFEKTEDYKVNLDGINSAEIPEKLYGKVGEDGAVTISSSSDGADYVLFNAKEYGKIGSVYIANTAYKDIIIEQEQLVNNNVAINNSLKEFVELERLKTKEYQHLWIDSENMYRDERQQLIDNEKSNKFFNILIQIGYIGSIIALSL